MLKHFQLDLSPNNVVLGLHGAALTKESLNKSFKDDKKVAVALYGVRGSLMSGIPRLTRLPGYLVYKCGPGLASDGEDMSRVEIIDFGKGMWNCCVLKLKQTGGCD